jgi:hypothetical protein
MKKFLNYALALSVFVVPAIIGILSGNPYG